MKKLLITITAILFLSISFDLKAQSYKYAVGGRLGASNGLTFKMFLDKENAVDFILNFQSKKDYSYFRATGLYEIHQPINNGYGINWYYGGGASIGGRNYKPTDKGELLLSADGVVGLDYKFDEAPVNVSLDWKPAFEVVPNTRLDASGVGLSVRFTF
jgi:hypothetical protein